MNSIKFYFLSALLVFSSPIFAQPNTEIFLFDLEKKNDTWKVTNSLNISDNEGYDNQPSFWGDGKSILYARTTKGQTEIARYFIEKGNTVMLTDTPQGSEYSPTPMPDGRISSIRLDTTGLQLLYAYDLKGGNEVLVEDLVIGYHAWINATSIVAFVLGEISTMQIINTTTDDAVVVGEKIGRSLHKIPKSKHFSYVDKSTDNWTINSMDPETQETLIITPTLAGAEDYTWTPGGQIIMGKGAKLFLWESNKAWKEIADLTTNNISNISRLSVSPNGKKLVLVSE